MIDGFLVKPVSQHDAFIIVMVCTGEERLEKIRKRRREQSIPSREIKEYRRASVRIKVDGVRVEDDALRSEKIGGKAGDHMLQCQDELADVRGGQPVFFDPLRQGREA